MSFSSVFSIAVSGVNAFAKGLAAASSNIANTGTIGFKRMRTEFSDLVTTDAPDMKARVGTGVGAVNRTFAAEQGAVTRTNTATNVAVAGAGFLVVSADELGRPPFLFTRSGDFLANAAGDLVNGAGYRLQGYATDAAGAADIGGLAGLQPININRAPPLGPNATPPGPLTGVDIDREGRVIASYQTGERIALYRIPLALFPNPEGLEETRGTAFRQTSSAGPLALAGALSSRAGAIEGQALEISTVDLGREFSTLIETQRAYATNARAISVADELWRRTVETAA
jgi:flagellar hook protein FlgE